MTKILCLFTGCYFCLHLVWAQIQRHQDKLLIEYSVLARINRAKEILSDTSFKCERSKSEVKMFVALWDSLEKKIEIVTLNKSFGKIKTDQEIEITEIELSGPNTYLVPGHELLAVKTPFRIKGTNSVKEVIYTPYSLTIDCPEIQEEGKLYLDSMIDAAFKDLEEKQVKSLSFPKKSVTEVVSQDIIRNLIIVEQLPYDSLKTMEERVNMVFAILGANKEVAFNYTTSGKRAVGLAQFIRPTYKRVIKMYPQAELDAGFDRGARNHLNAIVGMILLCDANAGLVKNSNLEVALARMYNGGTSKKIREETKGYLKKYGSVKDTIG